MSERNKKVIVGLIIVAIGIYNIAVGGFATAAMSSSESMGYNAFKLGIVIFGFYYVYKAFNPTLKK